MSAICNTPEQNATWPCMGHGAATCRLYPCIRTYRAEEINGRFAETCVSTSEEWDFAGFRSYSTADVTCLSSAEVKSLTDYGFSINETTRWLRYGKSFRGSAYSDQPNLPKLPGRCTYYIDYWNMWSIREYMHIFFSGDIRTGPLRPGYERLDKYDAPTQPFS